MAERGIAAIERNDWASAETPVSEALAAMLLPTHLTLAEMSERLLVSRNTVKTQAISIYRKLGVSSRGETVARMYELGLAVEPELQPRR